MDIKIDNLGFMVHSLPSPAISIDKALLLNGGSIGGVFLPVNGYFASKSRGWRYGWEREECRRRQF